MLNLVVLTRVLPIPLGRPRFFNAAELAVSAWVAGTYEAVSACVAAHPDASEGVTVAFIVGPTVYRPAAYGCAKLKFEPKLLRFISRLFQPSYLFLFSS